MIDSVFIESVLLMITGDPVGVPTLKKYRPLHKKYFL